MPNNFIKNTFWGWVLVGVIAAATLFALVIISFLPNSTNFDNSEQLQDDNIQVNSEAKVQPQTRNENADWIIYSNKVYGFEMSHPGNWTLVEGSKMATDKT